MFLLIYLSLILSVWISSTTSSDHLANSCFNFGRARKNKTNLCYVNEQRNATDLLGSRRMSIHCYIQYVDIVINRNCSKYIDTVSLIFQNNAIFEKFFKGNRDKFETLYRHKQNASGYYVLDIFIDSYNISNITYQYINSTININASHTRIFIWFRKHLLNSSPPTVVDEAFPIKFQLLGISVDCDNQTSAHYIVNSSLSGSNKPYIVSPCSPFSTTTQVSFLQWFSVEKSI